MKELKRIVQKIREGKLKRLLGELLWMYTYVRRYWALIGVYILLGASGSLLGLGTSIVSRDLVDAITGVNSKRILQVALTYIGVGVFQIVVSAVKTRLSLRVRLKVNNEIRADIYEQVLNTDWPSLSAYRSGDLLYRVNGDSNVVANSILTFIPSVVSSCVSLGGAFLVVIRNDPMMALLALAGAPVSFFTTRYSARKMRQFQRENQEMASNRTVFDQETFQNLQFIKAFGILDQITERFHTIQNETVEIALRQNKVQSVSMILTSLVGQAIGYACYGFAAFRLWQGGDQLRNHDHVCLHGRILKKFFQRDFKSDSHGGAGRSQRQPDYGSGGTAQGEKGRSKRSRSPERNRKKHRGVCTYGTGGFCL